jgi:hypothetical protein
VRKVPVSGDTPRSPLVEDSENSSTRIGAKDATTAAVSETTKTEDVILFEEMNFDQ